MKELTAINASMKIVERFIDGVRYIKVSPANIRPMVIEKIKQTLSQGEVEITESSTGWLKIEKKKISDKLKMAAEKLSEKHERLDEDEIIEQEAKMLRSVGLMVTIKEIPDK